MAQYISSTEDIKTWVVNNRPDVCEHGLRAALVEIIRSSDHPAWGADWETWLDDQIGIVEELEDADWTTISVAARYVACCFGADGDEPGDVEVSIQSVLVQGVCLYRVHESESGDNGEIYTTQEQAEEAAQEWADERNEANIGEDANGMMRRLLAERAGTPVKGGRWACYWETALDDAGPRSRHATKDAAEAAAELAQLEFEDNNPGGTYLCGYVVRELVDDEWVACDDED